MKAYALGYQLGMNKEAAGMWNAAKQWITNPSRAMGNFVSGARNIGNSFKRTAVNSVSGSSSPGRVLGNAAYDWYRYFGGGPTVKGTAAQKQLLNVQSANYQKYLDQLRNTGLISPEGRQRAFQLGLKITGANLGDEVPQYRNRTLYSRSPETGESVYGTYYTSTLKHRPHVHIGPSDNRHLKLPFSNFKTVKGETGLSPEDWYGAMFHELGHHMQYGRGLPSSHKVKGDISGWNYRKGLSSNKPLTRSQLARLGRSEEYRADEHAADKLLDMGIDPSTTRIGSLYTGTGPNTAHHLFREISPEVAKKWQPFIEAKEKRMSNYLNSLPRLVKDQNGNIVQVGNWKK